jgi:MFS family permease
MTSPAESYALRRRWYKANRRERSGLDFAEDDAERSPLMPAHNAGTATETVVAYQQRRLWFRDQMQCSRRRCRAVPRAPDFVAVTMPEAEEPLSQLETEEPLDEQAGPPPEAVGRWRALGLLVIVVWLGLGTWFSAGAVLPQLIAEYGVDPATASLLSVFVNVGFLCGALLSSATGLPDRYPPQRIIAVGTTLAALCNAALLLPGGGFVWAVALRFGSGGAMALVYPVACKFTATWFVRGRGTAMGAVVAATTLGSASPHLVNVLVPGIAWQTLVLVCSAASFSGGLLALALLRPGPHLRTPAAKASTQQTQQEGEDKGGWREVLGSIMANRELLCAVAAYSGHNWELYGMWSNYHAFALRSVSAGGEDGGASTASAIAFGVIGCGCVSSILAGVLADRVGRTTICLVSCTVSALVSMCLGGMVENTAVVVVAGVVWGLSIIADSGQYSAMVAELADPERVGTSLTIQFAVGFAATMPTMYLVPALASGGDASSWGWAFRALSPGPVLAVCALLRLRRLPRARLMAGGKM